MRRRTVLLALLAVLATVGLGSVGSSRCSPFGGVPQCPCSTETAFFLKENSPRYEQSVDKAQSWLEHLHVDPFELRKQGVKGKKKITEHLDAFYRLWQIAPSAEKPPIIARIEKIVAITYEPRYHDMATVSDDQFKEDATSYLRAALLMDRLGLDTELYRREIAAINPRLNAHMGQRGPFQREVFGWYYRHFGLVEPFPLDGSLREGYIARREDPSGFDRTAVYQLTHEVFVPYEYGERLDADPFDAEDKAYLRSSLEGLISKYIERDDPDLVAELVSCMRFLRFVESPSFRDGLRFLLASQNDDGSWGDAGRVMRDYGHAGKYRITLHTTTVALDALTVSFFRPWNDELYPGCWERHRWTNRANDAPED